MGAVDGRGFRLPLLTSGAGVGGSTSFDEGREPERVVGGEDGLQTVEFHLQPGGKGRAFRGVDESLAIFRPTGATRERNFI